MWIFSSLGWFETPRVMGYRSKMDEYALEDVWNENPDELWMFFK
jgi:hypothetical protein